MKKKILVVVSALALLSIAYGFRPYVAVVADPAFGVAVSVRSSIMHKFEPLFIWRFSTQ